MTVAANPTTLSFEQAQEGYRENAKARRAARHLLESALQERAQHEHDYRKALSVAFAKQRAKEKVGAGEAEIHAKADAADFALKRDLADAKSKGAQARLAELEGERASLRQLVDWSQSLDGAGA